MNVDDLILGARYSASFRGTPVSGVLVRIGPGRSLWIGRADGEVIQLPTVRSVRQELSRPKPGSRVPGGPQPVSAPAPRVPHHVPYGTVVIEIRCRCRLIFRGYPEYEDHVAACPEYQRWKRRAIETGSYRCRPTKGLR